MHHYNKPTHCNYLWCGATCFWFCILLVSLVAAAGCYRERTLLTQSKAMCWKDYHDLETPTGVHLVQDYFDYRIFYDHGAEHAVLRLSRTIKIPRANVELWFPPPLISNHYHEGILQSYTTLKFQWLDSTDTRDGGVIGSRVRASAGDLEEIRMDRLTSCIALHVSFDHELKITEHLECEAFLDFLREVARFDDLALGSDANVARYEACRRMWDQLNEGVEIPDHIRELLGEPVIAALLGK